MIYKITKGQLISLWVFGVIGWFYTVDSYSDFASFLSIFIPAILVFYTIGWRNFNKKNNEKESFLINIKNKIPSRKKIIKSIIAIVIIFIVISGISYLIETKQDNLRNEQLKQEYDEAISKIDNLKAEFSTCMKPVVDKKYEEEMRDCNLYKNKVKQDYTFCASLTSVTSPASCLYQNDYERIDCSQETIRKKAQRESLREVPKLCMNSFNEISYSNNKIKEYESLFTQ